MFGPSNVIGFRGRNKTGFIDGSCRRSNVDEVLGSDNGIESIAVVLELKETYDKVDGFVTFNLHHKIHTMKQNGSTLADYYHNLNALWKQFDCLVELPRCTCHAADDFKKHNQLMKLMQFLMGLDDSYMSIRSSILSRDPLPDVRNAYATISSEESHKVIASSMSDSSQRTQTVAFASNAPNRTVFQRGQSSNSSFRPNNFTILGPRTITIISIDKMGVLGWPIWQDLNLKNVLGIGNQCGGLYYLDSEGMNCNKNDSFVKSCLSQQGLALQALDILQIQSEKCVMRGYSSRKKVIGLYRIDKHQFKFSRDVKFFETVFPFKDSVPKVSKSDIDVCQDVNHLNFFDLDYPEIPYSGVEDLILMVYSCQLHDEQVTTLEENTSSEGNEDVNPMTSSQGNQNLRRSSRVSVFPRNYNDFVVESKVKYGLEKFVGYANLDDENLCFVTELNKSHEPKTFLEASRYPHWADAMNKEMEALLRNDTWELVELPKNRKAISSKWLWKIKYKSNGEIERYKARLVALGCNQREGIDYEETFSPVVKMVTVRCLMNIAVLNDWPMFQLDIDNAFLYGDLDETVYMKPPQGYYDTECNKVCRLKKSLYGLKQAPRQWNAKLTGALIENGFNQSKSDYSLFTKSDNGVFLALLVYVDDIIITGNNSSEIDKFKEFLRTKFMIKDLGNLKYFLGIEVINTDKGICLNQRKYVLDLLSDYGMLACKPARTPMISKLSVSNEESESDPLLDNVVDYQKLMGKLIYLTNTRPDISYAVHCLSQFMHAPLKSHLRSAFKILRYLKGSPGLGIHVTKTSGMFLKAYSDADWAKCVVTRKSVTGYCVFINDNLISWKSKKQNTISKSSSEAEYRALASVTSEVIWILKVLKDLGYNNLLPVSLYCDSKPAIKIAANPVFHERTKHLEIDLHFVREKILKGIVKTFKVDSANQIADILTKGLDTIQHDKLVKDLGMINLYQI
ncbi:putative RNA-directed DNA polymerase [Tanacetum coccineum]